MNQEPQAAFNLWAILFCGLAFIGLFYSLKLLVASKNDSKNRILGIYLILQSITILEYVFHWTKLIYSVPYFSELSLLFPLSYGPLLVIYINRSFGNDKPLRSYFYHFLPFVIVLLLKLPFYVAPVNLRLYHTHEILFGRYFDYYPWLLLCHLSVYCVVLVLLVRSQSGVGSMLLWAKWLTGFFIAFVMLSFLYFSMSYFQALSSQSDYFISLATCATIFLIAWYGHGFDAVANGHSLLDSLKTSGKKSSVSSTQMIVEVSRAPESDNDKYRHSGLPKSLALKLVQDLERLMQSEKLYHQNDLRLETLAEKLNSNKHFVSQVINQDLKMTFFDYINLKRIEEAKQLLRTTPREEMNIIEVAYAVGFNNKGTFNSVFKKITGVTPTEFRRQSRQLLDTTNN